MIPRKIIIPTLIKSIVLVLTPSKYPANVLVVDEGKVWAIYCLSTTPTQPPLHLKPRAFQKLLIVRPSLLCQSSTSSPSRGENQHLKSLESVPLPLTEKLCALVVFLCVGYMSSIIIFANRAYHNTLGRQHRYHTELNLTLNFMTLTWL